MKRLGFPSERELNLQLAIANAELAPTTPFCGKDTQCWFTGTMHEVRNQLPYQVTPRLSCAACVLFSNKTVHVNSPESATALDFHSFLTEHYANVIVRSKPKTKHKAGRPKDSANGGNE